MLIGICYLFLPGKYAQALFGGLGQDPIMIINELGVMWYTVAESCTIATPTLSLCCCEVIDTFIANHIIPCFDLA